MPPIMIVDFPAQDIDIGMHHRFVDACQFFHAPSKQGYKSLYPLFRRETSTSANHVLLHNVRGVCAHTHTLQLKATGPKQQACLITHCQKAS